MTKEGEANKNQKSTKKNNNRNSQTQFLMFLRVTLCRICDNSNFFIIIILIYNKTYWLPFINFVSTI